MRAVVRHQGRADRFAQARRYSSGGEEQADRHDRAGSKYGALDFALPCRAEPSQGVFGRRGGFDHAIREREQ